MGGVNRQYDLLLVESREIDPVKGRGLVAKTCIPSGTAIIEEFPLVLCQFSWNRAYGYAACDFCMRPLETVQANVNRLLTAGGTGTPMELPQPEACYDLENNPSPAMRPPVCCEACHIDWYCSLECRQHALEQYHHVLCMASTSSSTQDIEQHPIRVLEEMWKQMHFPPETCSILLLMRILAMIASCHSEGARMAFLGKLSQFCRHNHPASCPASSQTPDTQHFLKMLRPEFSEQLENLRVAMDKALNHQLVRYSQTVSFPAVREALAQFLSPTGFRELFTLIGRNAQGIATSPLAMWRRAVDKATTEPVSRKQWEAFVEELYERLEQSTGEEFLDNEGSGLYAVQSLLNHSCDANAEVVFDGSNAKLRIVTRRPIAAGEEVCIDYLDQGLHNRNCEQSQGCCSDGGVKKRSRHSRQKMLREFYLFQCQCALCISQADDASVSSGDDSWETEDEEEDMDT